MARLAFAGILLAATACGFDGGGPSGPDDDDGDEAGADAGGAVEACAVSDPGDELEVATTRGLVRGERDGEVLRYRGIPFAAPPVGERRFRAPETHACWDGVRDATAFGAMCPQNPVPGGALEGDEDCLFLNVWAPEARTEEPRPVLFWIHGGAQVMGSAGDGVGPLSYDGRWLAEREGVVVVSANYRLGALGFLAHPALDAESAQGVSGNYGLRDLVAALAWVQENAAAFGGDPARVMVFGESAGAFNTCGLVASPLARGLFSAALMESGICDAPTLAEREARGAVVAGAVGCEGDDAAACLRDAAVEDLVATGAVELGAMFGTPEQPIDPHHVMDLPFGLAVDGVVLPRTPRAQMAAGEHNRVPIVIGTNANEHDLFIPPGTVTSCAAYEQRLAQALGDELGADVADEYPCPSWWEAQATFSDAMSDMTFTCPSRRAARAARAGQAEPVFRYLYTHRREQGPLALVRAAHTLEIPFVFGTVGTAEEPASEEEYNMSRLIGRYWTRLARAGSPNGDGDGDGDPAWTACSDADCDEVLRLDTDGAMAGAAATAHCDFWDGIE